MIVPSVVPAGVFPYGTHVYREPYKEQDQLIADLPRLRQLGFTMIKVQESWAVDEPSEQSYDFSRIERIIAEAARHDLGVYLGLTMEQAPMWAWRRYPDAYLVDSRGQAHNDPTRYSLPTDAKPGPCWDHPGMRAAGERFVEALVTRLGRFDNLWVWNTWQEIGFWHNEAGVLGFCYCPHTLAEFRRWLADRYGSLDALNSNWFSTSATWDEVDPPRRYTSNPAFIDWRYFMDDVYLARALRWKTEALRKADPRGRPVFSHVGSAEPGRGADWRWAEVGDFYGGSNYPAWHPFHKWDDDLARRESAHVTQLQELWQGIMFGNDILRSATGPGKAFWGAEFQGGPISTALHLGRTPTAADIRRWVLGGMAAGMHGISFWNHRAEHFWEECNGFGLLDRRATTSERIEEAGLLGRALQRHADLFTRGTTPRAPVAVAIDEHLHHFAQGTAGDVTSLLQAEIRGTYARLWRLGIPVDFVELSRASVEDLAPYAVVLLPFPIAMDDGYGNLLREYVEGGGTLISGACPGRFTRYGFCTVSQMFDGAEELFGARQTGLTLVDEPGGDRRWTPTPRGAGEIAAAVDLTGVGELDGTSVRASFYLQTFETTTGSPLLRAGDAVAGVVNPVGRGRAVLLGTYAGLSAVAHRHQPTDDAVARLMTAAGVQPDRVGPLLRRRRVLDDTEAWFFINPAAEPVRRPVPLDGYELVGGLTDDMMSGLPADPVVEVPAVGVSGVIVRRR